MSSILSKRRNGVLECNIQQGCPGYVLPVTFTLTKSECFGAIKIQSICCSEGACHDTPLQGCECVGNPLPRGSPWDDEEQPVHALKEHPNEALLQSAMRRTVASPRVSLWAHMRGPFRAKTENVTAPPSSREAGPLSSRDDALHRHVLPRRSASNGRRASS